MNLNEINNSDNTYDTTVVLVNFICAIKMYSIKFNHFSFTKLWFIISCTKLFKYKSDQTIFIFWAKWSNNASSEPRTQSANNVFMEETVSINKK